MGGTLQILSAFSWKELFRMFFLFRANWRNCRYFICHKAAAGFCVCESCALLSGCFEVLWFSVRQFEMLLKNRAVFVCAGKFVKYCFVFWKVKVWLKSYKTKYILKQSNSVQTIGIPFCFSWFAFDFVPVLLDPNVLAKKCADQDIAINHGHFHFSSFL